MVYPKPKILSNTRESLLEVVAMLLSLSLKQVRCKRRVQNSEEVAEARLELREFI